MFARVFFPSHYTLLSVAAAIFELCCFAVVITPSPSVSSPYVRTIDHFHLYATTPHALYMFLVLTPQFPPSPSI